MNLRYKPNGGLAITDGFCDNRTHCSFSNVPSNVPMRRFFALLLIVFVLTGCYKNEQSDETATVPGSAPAAATLGIPMPTDEILAALGPVNNIPIQRLLPDTIYVAIGKPKRFLDSPASTDGEWFVAGNIARMLQ